MTILKKELIEKKKKYGISTGLEVVSYLGVDYVYSFSLVCEKKGICKTKVVKLKGEDKKLKSEELLENYIEYCFICGDNVVFYFHDTGNFVTRNLLEVVSKSTKYGVDMLSSKDMVYKLTLKLGKKEEKIDYRNTYLLLPISLGKLWKSFVEKGQYGYKRVHIELSCSLKVLENLGNEKVLVEKSLKKCLILREALRGFSTILERSMNIRLEDSFTISGLSYKLFRKHYYNEKKTPIEILSSTSSKYRFVEKSYHGGFCEVYSSQISDAYEYDVNSLYPYIMLTEDMPTGKGVWTKDLSVENFFGFVFAKVKAPSYIRKGFLSKVTGDDWFYDVYFSEELTYARKLGYKIVVLTGLRYVRKKVFKNYIKELYKFRLSYPGSHPLNTISKNIMNSLYGKLASKNLGFHSELLTEKELIKKMEQYIIEKSIKLGKKYYVVLSPDLRLSEGNRSSVQVASSITAYSRVYMHKYINNLHIDCSYADTDSIFSSLELGDHMVSSSTIGKFKLVNKIKEGVFLTRKAYYIKYKDGSEKRRHKGVDASEVDIEKILGMTSSDSIKLEARKEGSKHFVSEKNRRYTSYTWGRKKKKK